MTLEYLQKTAIENLGVIISAVAGLIGLVSLVFSRISYNKVKKQRSLLEFLGKQNENLEESLTKSKELIETSRQRSTDQACRIAWLETRVRQPKSNRQEEVIVDEVMTNKTLKLNMTERRHRVLSLAARGQNPEKIASTLGMMQGEVELIVKLSQVNLAAN